MDTWILHIAFMALRSLDAFPYFQGQPFLYFNNGTYPQSFWFKSRVGLMLCSSNEFPGDAGDAD